jgi:1-acyl-sn-glycerol-3-phosphate acyltransferase
VAQTAAPPRSAPTYEDVLERVLEVVRGLARETGGDRAQRAAAAGASLDREVGLGSLERVELLLRLERAFGRSLDDRYLQIDTPAGLASALLEAGDSAEPLRLPERPAELPAARMAHVEARTVHESLFRHAQSDPDRPTVYMREDDGGEDTITYGRLWRESAAVAGGLAERGVKRGDTVALMLPTGMDFLRSFQGILIAGGIPVPIYPPVRLDRLGEYAARQSAILADAQVRVLITVPRAMPIASLLKPNVPSLVEVTTADDLVRLGATAGGPGGEGKDAAFIQYTSGSTGQPKGVLLTHDNLLANIRAIGAGLEARPTDVGVSWLPLYHDMGLIGSWLFCLHDALPIAILSPLAFLARPERWLWTLHQRRGTLSAAPNFAYELCVRRITDAAIEGLDLSSWRCALNGAEPVNPDTLERFARRFGPYGFRRETMFPVYGLAENSVALCFPPVGRGPKIDRVARGPFQNDGRAEAAPEGDRQALRFVSTGAAVAGHEVRIVGAEGNDLGDRVVGRLVFRGPSMTSGYYRKPEATAAMTLDGGWLDSGDLAYRAEGEVYIAGRKKDLIIKAGRNLVPQEIEEAASTVEGIRKGCVVAIGVEHATLGTESLVVVAETRKTDALAREQLVAAVIERVVAAVEVPPDAVCLVAPGVVPKTSSGKIRRAATKEMYVKGELGRPAGISNVQRLRLLGGAALAAVRPRLAQVRSALYMAYLAVVLPLLVLPLWLLVWLLPTRRVAFALGRLTVRLGWMLTGSRLSVEGLEHLPRGSFVLASNHASYTDVPALMALLPLDFLFVAKREVLSYPVVGTYVRRAGHLTVDRLDAQQGVADTEASSRALAAGEAVLFFPEGTFTAATGLRPFRLGAFKTAAEAGVPVVPMALLGTRQVLRGDSPRPHPGRVRLWIGPPVMPGGTDWNAVVAFRDRVAEVIAAHCGEPRLDLVAAGPERPPS